MGRITALTKVQTGGGVKTGVMGGSVGELRSVDEYQRMHTVGWAPWAARADYMGNSISFDMRRTQLGDYVDCDAIARRKSETIRAYRAQAWRVLSELDGVDSESDAWTERPGSEQGFGVGHSAVSGFRPTSVHGDAGAVDAVPSPVDLPDSCPCEAPAPIVVSSGGLSAIAGSFEDQELLRACGLRVRAATVNEGAYATDVKGPEHAAGPDGSALPVIPALDQELLRAYGLCAQAITTEGVGTVMDVERREAAVAVAASCFGASNSDMLGTCYARNLTAFDRQDAVGELGTWPTLGDIRRYVEKGGPDEILDGVVVGDGLFLHVLSDAQVDLAVCERYHLRTLRDDSYDDHWRVGGVAAGVAVTGLVFAAGICCGLGYNGSSVFDLFLLSGVGRVPAWDHCDNGGVHRGVWDVTARSLRDNPNVRLIAQQQYCGDTCLALHCMSETGVYDLHGSIDGRMVLACSYATGPVVDGKVEWPWREQPGDCDVHAVIPDTVGTVVYLRLYGPDAIVGVPVRTLLSA